MPQDQYQMIGRGCTLSPKYPMHVPMQQVPPTRSIPPLEVGKPILSLVDNNAHEQTQLEVTPPMEVPLGAYAGPGVCPRFRRTYPIRAHARFLLVRPLLVHPSSPTNGPHPTRASARRRFAKTRILVLGQTHHPNRNSSSSNPRPLQTASLR
jgi:hypothetical protein